MKSLFLALFIFSPANGSFPLRPRGFGCGFLSVVSLIIVFALTGSSSYSCSSSGRLVILTGLTGDSMGGLLGGGLDGVVGNAGMPVEEYWRTSLVSAEAAGDKVEALEDSGLAYLVVEVMHSFSGTSWQPLLHHPYLHKLHLYMRLMAHRRCPLVQVLYLLLAFLVILAMILALLRQSLQQD